MVEEACTYWRLALEAFTRDDLRSWNFELLKLLLETADDDLETLSDCNIMCKELDRLGDVGTGLLRTAFALDPSGRGELYSEACSLDKYIRKLCNSAGEMALLRQDSPRLLEEFRRDGSLICQTL